MSSAELAPRTPDLPPPRRIAVVGGGASGAIFALHMRRQAGGNTELTVIEPRAELGAGIAYSTSEPVHRINVSAARMSLFADRLLDFDEWCREQGVLADDPDAAVGDFLFPRRGWFARYVAARLAEAGQGGIFRHERQSVVEITPEAGHYQLRLNSGQTLVADTVVLATGNPPADLPAPLRAFGSDRNLTSDPWRDGALADVAPNARILIVGAGLTMGDTVANLVARGHTGSILAISRHGLLSRSGSRVVLQPQGVFADVSALTALGLLRRFRREAARFPWRSVVDALRSRLPAIWAEVPAVEQRRLARHVRVFWEAHRFSMAPPVHDVVVAAEARGQLAVAAGRVISVERTADGLEVSWRRRGVALPTRVVVDRIINATGPGFGRAIQAAPLAGLAEQGLVVADPLGFGLGVDTLGRTANRSGAFSDTLFAIGPIARGARGELSGIREISDHALRLAEYLAVHPAQTIINASSQ